MVGWGGILPRGGSFSLQHGDGSRMDWDWWGGGRNALGLGGTSWWKRCWESVPVRRKGWSG